MAIAEYTMLYDNYMSAYGAPKNLALIPSITIGDTTYKFDEMFNDRFKYREICCESSTYFTHLANRVLKEAALIFSDKIKGFEKQLGNLWNREETVEEKSYSNYYLNPTVSAKDGEPKLQSTSESIYPHHITYNTQSTAELINGALQVENIYYECLLYCEKLFFSLY